MKYYAQCMQLYIIMASKNGSVINVVVCGLTTSSWSSQDLTGQGAGKSYLCNRFVDSLKQADLINHTSLYNKSNFESKNINQDHFLYWGQKVVGLEDGHNVIIQVRKWVYTYEWNCTYEGVVHRTYLCYIICYQNKC